MSSLQHKGELEVVFESANTGRTARWSAVSFVDKSFFTAPSVPPIYWQPGLTQDPDTGKCRAVAGLPDSDGFDGVSEFAGHLLLWRGQTLKWSDLNDIMNWIPVALTAATGRAVAANDVAQPDVGSNSAFVSLTDFSGEFVVDQFVRIVSNEDDASRIRYSYYQVAAVASELSATTSIEVDQSVPASSTGTTIYTAGYIDFKTSARLSVAGSPKLLEVLSTSRNVSTAYTLDAASSAVGAVGTTVSFPLSSFPFDLKVGDIISVGTSQTAGQDLYTVTTLGQTLIARRLGIGKAQKGPGLTYAFGGSNPAVYVVVQPWVKVKNLSSTSVAIPSGSAVTPTNGLKLTNLGYTGAIKAGGTVPSGSIVETLDANEAGELENVGDGVNGSIFAVVKLADYAYILKQDSIQSVQYVGPASGVFFIRGEVYGEGPIGRYSWCRIDEKSIVIWGTKGWFVYSGGQNMVAIGTNHWKTADAELDRARVDEIVAFHHKPHNEIWFAYPVLGSAQVKVIVYNYEFNSVMVDTYGEHLNGITALGLVDWELAPTWESLPDTELFNSVAKRWYEYSDTGRQTVPVIGVGGDTPNPDYGEAEGTTVPRLLVQGSVPYRASSDDCAPDGVPTLVETMDTDFGDPALVKYVDTVLIGLQVKTKLAEHPSQLRVYLGSKLSLDDDVSWTDAATIDVTGNTNNPTKVNLRASGRYFRLKFESSAPGVQWDLVFWRLFARAGSTY